MNRFRRIFGRMMNVVCVVMVLAATVLYVRKQINPLGEGVMFVPDWTYSGIHLSDGQVTFAILRVRTAVYSEAARAKYPGLGPVRFYKMSNTNGETISYGWWFNWKFETDYSSLSIPLWFLILFFAIKPGWSFIAWKRRYHRLRDADDHPVCADCGYDLHGNTSSACPECGATMKR